jgi:hypothetical protein
MITSKPIGDTGGLGLGPTQQPDGSYVCTFVTEIGGARLTLNPDGDQIWFEMIGYPAFSLTVPGASLLHHTLGVLLYGPDDEEGEE